MLNVETDRNLARFDDAKRTVAKLMARENISVQIIDGVATAYFDTVGRVLTLPNWPFINVDQLDTQIGHEIGHALFTDDTWLEKLAKRRKDTGRTGGLFTYINVVEDARIERKMREAYPGMTRVFYNGRKAFSEKGPVFQVSDAKHIVVDGQKVAIASLRLIDRINCHYKIGAFIDVPFEPEEHKWIALIDKCYSTTNACEIAEQLHALAKEEREKRRKEQEEETKDDKKKSKSKSKSQSQSGDDAEDADDSGEESDASDKSKSKKSKSKKSKSSSAETDESESEESEESGKSGKGDESEDEDASDATGDSEDDEQDGSASGTAGDEDADEDADEDDSDGDSDDEGERTGNDPSPAPLGSGADADGASGEPDPASTTDKAMNQMLKQLAEQKTNSAPIKNLLIKPLDEKTVRERTVTAQEWVKLCETFLHSKNAESDLKILEETWNGRYLTTVRHLAAEFTRRKTAKNLQHARVGKTGRLDMTKLAKFQFAEDLFKHITTVPNGQSHGIVMIIDASSSMSTVFSHVVDQLLLFANFAFLCNIPFEGYLFTDRTYGYGDRFSMQNTGLQTMTLPADGRLVGLINTHTGRREFKRQVQMVLALQHAQDYNSPLHGLPYAALGNTPLHVGMMVMERHVERMKHTLRLDKVTAVVITDGADNRGLKYAVNTVDQTTGKIHTAYEDVGAAALVVRDTVTKKNHMLVSPAPYGGYSLSPNAVVTLLFDIMKERHGARGIMLYLMPASSQVHGAAVMMTREKDMHFFQQKDADTQLLAHKQYVLPAGAGVADCSMALLTAALTLQESNFAQLNTAKMTADRITKAFVEQSTRAQANRIFVNTIIPFLA